MSDALRWTEPTPAPRLPRPNPALLREAVARRPDAAELHERLGRALAAEGRHEDALESFRRALELEPARRSAHAALADGLDRLGRHAEAAEEYRRLAQAHPERPGLHLGLGRALRHLDGHGAEARAAFETALRLAPGDYRVLHHLVHYMVLEGAVEEALALCDRQQDAAPADAGVLALRSQLLVATGRHERAAALMDFDGLLKVSELDAPEGHADTEAFNEALARSIRANRGLEFEPRGRTTVGGDQADLSGHGDRPEAALFRRVRSAMEAYREEVLAAGPTDHPFRVGAPSRARLSMWTVVLREGGHQGAHIHPGGWVSAVYYVTIPDGDPEDVGPLVVGGSDPSLELEFETPPETRRVVPRPGLLVLFPAFYYHHTIPTRTTQERICVAFNMVADG